MTIKTWLDTAIQDAERRNLPGLRPLLETLARSTSALRSADWNFDATGEPFDSAQGRPLDPARGKPVRISTPDAR
jgi:hypothetical protein